MSGTIMLSATDKIRTFITNSTDRFTAREIEAATGVKEPQVRPILNALVEMGEIIETTGIRVNMKGRPRKAFLRAR